MNISASPEGLQAQHANPRKKWGGDVVNRRIKLKEVADIIPGFLAPGLTVLVAGPYIGKSYLAQQIEHLIAYGTPLGDLEVTENCRCLVIAYETSQREWQRRSLRITPMGTLDADTAEPDEDGTYNSHEMIWVATSFPTEHDTFAERLAQLDHDLSEFARFERPIRYVRIDTLFRFVGGNTTGENAYHFDYRVSSQLNALALKHDCAILGLHHTRKDSGEDKDWVQRASGSLGYAAGATAMMFLQRVRGADTGILRVTSNTAGEAEHAMSFQDGLWEFDDTLSLAEARHTRTPREILQLLRERGPLMLWQLAEDVDATTAAIKKALQRLREEGDVSQEKDYWSLTSDKASTIMDGDTGDTEDVGDVGDTGDVVSSPLPAPRAESADAGEEEELDDAPEAFPAIQHMKDGLKKSRMHPIPVVRKAERTTGPWPIATRQLSAGVHKWASVPAAVAGDLADGWVVTLDRNGSYPSACSNVPVAPNVLKHNEVLGELDRERAGMYLIETEPWTDDRIGSPLGYPVGDERTGWFTDSHLELLDKVGHPYTITESWTGNRNASLFEHFCDAVRDARAATWQDPERYVDVKRRSSIAIRLLYPQTARSPFWRPDWWVAIVAQANVRHWVKAWSAVDKHKEFLLSIGGTDEVTYWTDSEDPGWVPAGYKITEPGTEPKFGSVKIKGRVPYTEWVAAHAAPRRSA